MSLNVCVAGATGWVGKPLCAAIESSGDLNLVGAVSRSREGSSVSNIIGEGNSSVVVRSSVREALSTATDVLVDFTSPDTVKDHVLTAVSRGVHVVVGTSGLTESDFLEIDQAASDNKVGVIAGGNFALTAILLQRFACEAAKHVGSWEIIDYASGTKPDSPSGTARELAFLLSRIKEPVVSYPIEQTIGPRESRGATLNGSQIHSVRLPSYTLSIEVIFGGGDERLTIRHDAGAGAAPYIQGTLLGIRRVSKLVGLVRGLGELLDS